MNTFSLRTGKKASIHALAAELTGNRILHQMIGANKLSIMGCINNTALVTGCLFPLTDLQNNAGGQLIIKVIQMTYIRLEILQHQAQLFTGLNGINGADGIEQLGKLGTAMKVHI
jgi:hypothetical protein